VSGIIIAMVSAGRILLTSKHKLCRLMMTDELHTVCQVVSTMKAL
jgi:hypothetical protein